ncbi:hypothetical protein LCGC14_2622610 [marine sediment metagenome]|uniref:Uncharacterized protein n=1 Tax=marine sediment metagenome TaxID=412755 RepID=A0A0F9CDP7_9ZZZZ|nr:hypothetical protein [Candidatus Scalindua sp.]
MSVYYFAVVRKDTADGVPLLATNLQAISDFTGIPVKRLSYHLTRKGMRYYWQREPNAEVWKVNDIHKIHRPQYDNPAYNKKKREQ